MIRVDQGTEFVSRDFDLWAYQCGVTLWRTARPERNRLEKNPGRPVQGWRQFSPDLFWRYACCIPMLYSILACTQLGMSSI